MNNSTFDIVNAVCKDYDVVNKNYSRCEHLQAEHETNDCGDIWCNKCLNICVFCVDCTSEISDILVNERERTNPDHC